MIYVGGAQLSDTQVHRRMRLMRWDQMSDRERDVAAPDPVFFASSNTQTFESEAHRIAFRAQWLGQFLNCFPDLATLALNDRPACAGYCIAWPSNPLVTGDFGALDYLRSAGKALEHYPAQIHINVSAEQRSAGLGSQLLHATLARLATAYPAPGVHIFTEHSARNRSFYLANGFSDNLTVRWQDRQLVMMVRDLRS